MSDICAMLQSTKNHSMLEWLRYEGKVEKVQLYTLRQRIQTRFSKRQGGNVWKIDVRDGRLQRCWTTLPGSRKGDLIYSLNVPSSSRLPEILLTFRQADGYVYAIDAPLGYSQWVDGGYSALEAHERHLGEYESVRGACIGGIQLCDANTIVAAGRTISNRSTGLHGFVDHLGPRSLDPQIQQELAVAHISYTAMLTLTAWYACKKIPDYLKQWNREDSTCPRLCKGGDSVTISINTSLDGQEKISASWSCCVGSE